jgi:3-oxoacyl-[acyl-carrier-protein] synthase-3
MNVKAYLNFISYYIPTNLVDNDLLANEFGNWSAEQIFRKTGINQRFVSNENEFVTDLALNAYKKILTDYNINPNSIDYLIFVTQTPEYLLPGSSFIFQHKAKIAIPSIDINSGCSGFNNALFIAKNLIETEQQKKILIITSETYSKIINKKDKSVRTLFGDAASATIVSNEKIGFLIGNFDQGSSPNDYEKLIVPGIGVKGLKMEKINEEITDKNGYIRKLNNLYMDGPGIMSFTLNHIPDSLNRVIVKNGLNGINEVDNIVLHQASMFVLNSLKSALNLNENNNFIVNLIDKGNTVSSSIPIAIKENLSQFKVNSKLLTCGFGVGLTWSSCIMIKV